MSRRTTRVWRGRRRGLGDGVARPWSVQRGALLRLAAVVGNPAREVRNRGDAQPRARGGSRGGVRVRRGAGGRGRLRPNGDAHNGHAGAHRLQRQRRRAPHPSSAWGRRRRRRGASLLSGGEGSGEDERSAGRGGRRRGGESRTRAAIAGQSGPAGRRAGRGKEKGSRGFRQRQTAATTAPPSSSSSSSDRRQRRRFRRRRRRRRPGRGRDETLGCAAARHPGVRRPRPTSAASAPEIAEGHKASMAVEPGRHRQAKPPAGSGEEVLMVRLHRVVGRPIPEPEPF